MIRKKIISLLSNGPLTIEQLSSETELTEKKVKRQISNLRRDGLNIEEGHYNGIKTVRLT